MEKSHPTSLIREFYDLIESEKFDKAKAMFRQNVSEITRWEFENFQRYRNEHPKKIVHHIGFNKSYTASSDRYRHA